MSAAGDPNSIINILVRNKMASQQLQQPAIAATPAPADVQEAAAAAAAADLYMQQAAIHQIQPSVWQMSQQGQEQPVASTPMQSHLCGSVSATAEKDTSNTCAASAGVLNDQSRLPLAYALLDESLKNVQDIIDAADAKVAAQPAGESEQAIDNDTVDTDGMDNEPSSQHLQTSTFDADVTAEHSRDVADPEYTTPVQPASRKMLSPRSLARAYDDSIKQ